MKARTYRHPKLLRLARRLELEPWAALGVVEALTEWARDFAPDGGLGRFQPADIAEGIGWRRDPGELLAALRTEGWLDGEGAGLLIHDWHAHADDAVQRSLARAGRLFANGERPSLVRLTKLERERALPLLEAAEAALRAHRAPRGRPPGALAGAPARPRPAPPGPAPHGPTRTEGAGSNGTGRTRARLPLTPWPEDFTLTDADRQFARDGGLDPGLIVGAMRDWALAKAERRQDWHAEFRSFCRKAVDRQRPLPTGGRR